MTGQWTIAANVRVHICLNGFKLTFAEGKRGFRVGANAGADVLDICDCSSGNTGLIETAKSFADHSLVAMIENKASNATLNLYNINIVSGELTSEKSMYGLFSTTTGTKLNIYGGYVNVPKIINAPTSKGGVTNVKSGAVCNVYGTTFTGGKAAFGGNFYVESGGELNLNNATLLNSDGEGNVYVSPDSKLTISGRTNITGGNNGNLVLGGTLFVGDAGIDGDSVIGFTAKSNFRFLYSDTDYSKIFVSDNDDYSVKYNNEFNYHIYKKNEISQVDENRKIDIYLLAGQSNAAGTSDYSSAYSPASEGERDLNKYENVKYYYYASLPGGNVFRNYTEYGPVQEGQAHCNKCIGPEMGMASVLDPIYAEKADTDALILKSAVGGTTLLYHQDENGNTVDITGKRVNDDSYNKKGSWYPTALDKSSAFGYYRTSGYLTRDFKRNITTVYNDLIEMGYKKENINFVGLSWMQGESDKKFPNEYKEVFQVWIKEIRDHISSVAGDDYSNLPLVIGEMAETSGSSTESSMTVNRRFISMQKTLPNVISNTITIPLKDFKVTALVDGVNTFIGSDEWHWKYTDMLKIGKLFANGVLSLVNGTADYHTHCECGDTAKGVGDHICNSVEKWVPVYCVEGLEFIQQPGEHWVYLENDIKFNKVFAVPVGSKLHICLNGHNIYGVDNDRVFHQYVEGDTELSIADCSGGGSVCAVGQLEKTKQGATLFVSPKGDYETKFNLYGGTIANGISGVQGNYGGNIALSNATFNMYGGVIENGSSPNSETNPTKGFGGNVGVDSSAVFNMYAGEIKNGSSATMGGNVSVSKNSTFNMYGGVISGGQSAKGGNIYVRTNSAFNAFGGEIVSAKSNGGLVLESVNIALSGDIVIKNNVGGNLVVDKDSTVLVGEMGNNSQVGVTLKSGNVIGEADLSAQSHFFADYGKYTVRSISGNLTVVLAGDLDADGSVTKDDISNIALIIARLSNESDPYKLAVADANCDGIIDINDVVILIAPPRIQDVGVVPEGDNADYTGADFGL